MVETQTQIVPKGDTTIDKVGVRRTMRRYVFLVFIFVIAAHKRGMAAESAAALIADVAQKVRGAAMWEAEGLQGTESEHGATGSRIEVPFGLSVENASVASATARARLEVMGGPNPLVRVCAGGIEWSYLVSGLHSPVIIGTENLKLADRTIKCTVIRGDFASQDPALAGNRTLWIDERSKMVWKYRIERPGGGTGESTPHLVQNYALLWQTRAGLRRSDDLWEIQPDEGAKEVSASSAKSEAVDPVPPMTRLIELPKNLYRIGGKVSPPVLIHKVEPAPIPRRHKRQTSKEWSS